MPPGLLGRQAQQAGPGLPGAAGTAAVTVHTQAYTIAASDIQTVIATCGAGQKAVGGGFDSNGEVFNYDTKATAADDGWAILLANPDSEAASGTVYAYCLRLGTGANTGGRAPRTGGSLCLPSSTRGCGFFARSMRAESSALDALRRSPVITWSGLGAAALAEGGSGVRLPRTPKPAPITPRARHPDNVDRRRGRRNWPDVQTFRKVEARPTRCRPPHRGPHQL